MSATPGEHDERPDLSDETIVMRRPRAEDTVVMPALAPPRPDEPDVEYRWWTPRPPSGGSPEQRPRRSWRRYALTAALFLVAAALGLGGGALVATQLHGGHGHGAAGRTAEAATPKHPAQHRPVAALLPVRQVGSFDPTGGSGFRQQGAGWVTQHYSNAAFGGLKPGVGLVIDLGHPARVGAVELVGLTPGTVVQLHAGDVAPHGNDPLPAAGNAVTASGGRTVLYPTGSAAHRYWVAWVTQLPANGGGYQTALAAVRVIAAKG